MKYTILLALCVLHIASTNEHGKITSKINTCPVTIFSWSEVFYDGGRGIVTFQQTENLPPSLHWLAENLTPPRSLPMGIQAYLFPTYSHSNL